MQADKRTDQTQKHKFIRSHKDPGFEYVLLHDLGKGQQASVYYAKKK